MDDVAWERVPAEVTLEPELNVDRLGTAEEGGGRETGTTLDTSISGSEVGGGGALPPCPVGPLYSTRSESRWALCMEPDREREDPLRPLFLALDVPGTVSSPCALLSLSLEFPVHAEMFSLALRAAFRGVLVPATEWGVPLWRGDSEFSLPTEGERSVSDMTPRERSHS